MTDRGVPQTLNPCWAVSENICQVGGRTERGIEVLSDLLGGLLGFRSGSRGRRGLADPRR